MSQQQEQEEEPHLILPLIENLLLQNVSKLSTSSKLVLKTGNGIISPLHSSAQAYSQLLPSSAQTLS